jgi:hypothetical protein
MNTRLFTAFAAACLLWSSCANPSDQVKSQEEQMALQAVQSAELPVIAFMAESHDFGTINEGEVVETEFKFTNTGEAPLIISAAQGSCGCTIPEYPKEPIAPGEEGRILVSFNSEGKPNQQSKTVTLTTNAVPSTKVLTITANVTPKSK